MCEKTMRRYVAGQIATASPELQDMIAYENEAHFEDFDLHHKELVTANIKSPN